MKRFDGLVLVPQRCLGSFLAAPPAPSGPSTLGRPSPPLGSAGVGGGGLTSTAAESFPMFHLGIAAQTRRFYLVDSFVSSFGRFQTMTLTESCVGIVNTFK